MKNLILAAAMAAATFTAAAPAAHAGSAQVGILVCQVESGSGFVFGSTKTLACTFTPQSGAPVESYTGVISRYGVDLGFTSNGLLTWAVVGNSLDDLDDGALAGRYGGVGAEVTAALGVGSNVLVRKSLRDCALQPISVQGQTGLNIALGVAEMELHSATK